MSTSTQGPFVGPLTHRDLDDTPDDHNRYEVINGVLYVSPFPTSVHQRIATRLVILLGAYVQEQERGEVFAAGLKVVLDEPTGVGPDLVYISETRIDGLRDDGYYGAPELVVEVLSSKPMLDTEIKKRAYEHAGIPHYWIVDPRRRCLYQYQLDGDHYALVAELSETDTFEPDLFPGLVIPLADLWW